MTAPLFLKKLTTTAPQRTMDKTVRDYRQMLGIWLIDLALLLGWHQTNKRYRWPDIFADDDFCVLTGLESQDSDDEYSATVISTSKCRQLLLKQRNLLQSKKMSSSLPLFTNIKLLDVVLGLTEAEQALLAFAAAMEVSPQFRSAISQRSENVSTQSLCRILSRLTGLPVRDFNIALGDKGVLVSTAIVTVKRSDLDIEAKLDLMEGFAGVLLSRLKSAEDLVGRFLKRAAPPTLSLMNFPHLASDSETLRVYLRNAVAKKTCGVNILLHGKPGVGKTEYVQALAKELGVDLYEIAYASESGEPIKGEARLRAYNLCQRFLANSDNSLLLFDEIEDVFPSDHGFLSMLFGEDEQDSGGKSAGKAWINRTLEQNQTPALWVSNRVDQIDPAYKRRFDYSIRFPLPPMAIRLDIARHHFSSFKPTQGWLERIAANDEISPAQFASAAKVARIACGTDKTRALGLIEQTLDRSVTLLGQKRTPSRNIARTGYSLDYLNTDNDIPGIVTGLKRRPRGTFCFYGAAGTGKSELARYLADEIGKPFLLRRASDIMSKWVGESEQNIAAMFSEARQQDAVLVLDEADSFLGDRRDAQRSWEITQVNELLTQMEAFDGIFICTTNLMEKLDPASLRRFAFKVCFKPLTSDQRWGMFQQELGRHGGGVQSGCECESKVRQLDRLTPGDFAVAARQFELWDIQATPEKLHDLLRKECEAKGAVTKRIGFGACSADGRISTNL